VMSAGLNAGMPALPNRDFEVSPSDTPNRDLDGIASRVMKIGPEESILRKKQVSPHKIGEYCARLAPDIGIPCYVLGIMLNDLMTAFLVAFAAVTASGLLTRIWEYF